MSRLLVGVTLERICKAVLLLCLLHFLIIMILYFDVYAQRLDFFSRFNMRNSSRTLPYVNVSRPNGTAGPLGPELLAPSVKSVSMNSTVTEKPLPPCPEMPPGLVGRLLIEFSTPMSMERVQRENPDVREGGKYSPPDCVPRQKVAILIPFRHREHHLKYWLHYLHPILRRQKVSYGIYIINQFGEDTFNRAKLLNVGFLEALRDDESYDCFIFSDVDLVPMDDRNLYRCYDQPRHFAVAMDKFGFRISLNGMKVSRPDARIGRYRMIKHERDRHNEPNPQRFTKIQNTKVTMKRDGIGSLQYRLVEVVRRPMYTNVTVEIGRPPPRPPRG
ncbi:beta-1,4-galactosyltransferase 2 isoform X2 [Podarcis raffonei]|uniref:Beta-1,4-galactosyltransferase n=1 Tax=Podarcis lilfordi TaxID=74358 RepID=A0AA35P712_9SAUR|nr:beta-1,4-galactosyltransferase 2 isoform X2 [Podarcis raffonei]CAI5777339.1 beta-1,4-galactosyltransferase 2 isoform X1 [Podarcis lilfordi]